MNYRATQDMMTETQIEVMIVSQPGLLQRILIDSLAGLPVSLMGIATGGLSAVEMLEGHQPDLVIVDANLPAKETQMLLRHIRETYPQIWCLALSETSRGRLATRQAGAHFSILSFELLRNLPAVISEVQASPGSFPRLEE